MTIVLFQFIILVPVQIAVDGMLLLCQQLIPVLHGLDGILQVPTALIQFLLLSGQPDLCLFQRLIVRDRVDMMLPLILMQILHRTLIEQDFPDVLFFEFR